MHAHTYTHTAPQRFAFRANQVAVPHHNKILTPTLAHSTALHSPSRTSTHCTAHMQYNSNRNIPQLQMHSTILPLSHLKIQIAPRYISLTLTHDAFFTTPHKPFANFNALHHTNSTALHAETLTSTSPHRTALSHSNTRTLHRIVLPLTRLD